MALSKVEWLAIAGLFAGLLAGLPTAPKAVAEPGEGDGSMRLRAERVIAFGDVHGAHDQLLALLRGLKVIDENDAWSAGSTHLVSLGDLLDRGPDSRKTLDLLMKLQEQARAAGGRVHVVLGNHELMNLTGDLRYVSAAEYAAFASTPEASGAAAPPLQDGQPPGFLAHRQAFAPDGRYGRWLLQQPSVLVVNDTAFVHAGLPPLAATMTPTALDRELKERLGALLRLRERLEGAGVIAPYTDVLDSAAQLRKRLDTTDGAAARLEPIADEYLPDARLFVALANDDLFSDKGPLWYRGTARCHHMLEAPVLDDVLAHWQISRAVMGHTPTPDHQVRQRFDGRAVLADTGMLKTYYKGQPAGVILSGGSVEVYYPETGTRTEGAEEIPILEIDGLGVEEVLQILQDGEVIPTAAAERPDGNLAVQVTHEGRKISALFQPSDKDGTANQLAAFALDQLLGLGIVAPVAERTVDGRRGVVSALWANAIDEAERTQRGSGLANWCGRGSIFNLMYALDALIGNDGRLPTTMIYEPATWRFMSTGHGRAFGRSAGFPAYLKNAPTLLPGGLAVALEQLDEAGLEEALGELTTRGERRALLKRRDRLLSSWTSGD